jgi:hypothetical protein
MQAGKMHARPCTNYVWIFRMLVFEIGRIRESYLSTSHAGSRPPSALELLRGLRVLWLTSRIPCV